MYEDDDEYASATGTEERLRKLSWLVSALFWLCAANSILIAIGGIAALLKG